MAAERRELVLDLLARNKMSAATDAAARDVDKLGTAAEKARKSTDGLGKASTETGRKTESFGRSANDAQAKVDNLGDEIRKVEQDLVLLAGAFAVAETKAERLDLAKGIRKSQAEIRQLSKAKGILEGILPDPTPASRSFMAKLTDGLSQGLPDLIGSMRAFASPVGAALGVGVAAVALPAITAALAAGAGGLGIGAGIMLAIKKDEGIKDAGKKVGTDFTKAVQDSAAKAFSGPLRSALGIVDDAADRAAVKVGKVFSNLAPSIVPLTRDLTQAFDRILDSVTNMASKSGPALAGLGDSVRLISDGVGDFLDLLSSGSAEGADSLRLLSGAMADLLRFTGANLKLFNELANNSWVTGPLIPLLKKHYKDAADESDNLKGSTAAVADSFTNAEKAARGELDALKGLSDELKAQTDPVFGLLDAQDNLAEAQKRAKEATKEHGAESTQASKANRDLAKAALDLEGRVGALGKAFNGQMTPALKATLRTAGVSEAAIADLERQFNSARRAGDRFSKTYRAKIITEYVTKYTTIVSNSAQSAYERTKAQIAGRRATGGPVERDRPYWVGENGPELMVPERNGRILSATQSRQAVAAGKHGSPTGTGQVLRIELAGQQELVTMFRYLVRTANLLQG